MNFYKRHLGDYARDTGHLSLLEHGAYTVLLDWSYASERPLPETMEAIFRLCRASSAAEKRAVEFVVNEFFPLVDGHRRNKRAVMEIADLLNVSEIAREKAHKRWHSHGNAAASGQHPPGNALQDSKTPDTRIGGGGGASPPDGFVPTDDDVFAFARDFAGELSTGTPGPIRPEFAAAWLARMLGRREFPPRWQRALIAEWRSACRTSAGEQKKNAPPAVGAGAPAWQQVAESRRLGDLKRQLREAQEERDALDQCGAEVPAELKKRCRELARELEAVARMKTFNNQLSDGPAEPSK